MSIWNPVGPKLGAYLKAHWPNASDEQALAICVLGGDFGLIWDGSLGPAPTPEEVAAWEPARDPLAEGVAMYRAANEAAREIVFVLMTNVAGILIAFGLFTEANVNDEGADFVAFHNAALTNFERAGRNAKAALALYNEIASAPSRAAFPWLEANDGYILHVFAGELGAEET